MEAEIHFFNCDTTCISYYSKNHSVTLLWGRLCLLQQNFITLKAVKLINELRCFHKHLHSSEISDKLHVHCDVKHKNSLSCPAIAI